MENSDKTARSIFVGNIPYNATEEELIKEFSKVGDVVGFRLVYDRESCKTKGYGFCEYNSPDIAASALRNLGPIEFKGRVLRIGSASGDTVTTETVAPNPPLESCYGNRVEPNEAGANISNAVASLSPEKLYEVMVQMKSCIQNNPNEARQLLLQNPQLTYALLQAQIAMKIIDPKVAVAMMTRSNEQIPLASVESRPTAAVVNNNHQQALHALPMPPMHYPSHPDQGHHSRHPMQSQMPLPQMMPSTVNQMPMPPHMMPMPPHMPQHFAQFQGQRPQPQQMPLVAAPPMDIKPEPSQTKEAIEMMNYFDSQGEKNKAALIMQVLSLTDEQVARLPEDQRRSIEVLKNQLRNT